MVQTHRRKKMRTRKRKGGSPTSAQLKWASKGLTRKNRPSPLKISKSPDDITKYVYNPQSPRHAKKLSEIRKQKMINNPLSPSYQLHFLEITNIPEYMNQDTQYFFIDDDKTREIFKFGMDDRQLQRTGFAYIDRKWEKL